MTWEKELEHRWYLHTTAINNNLLSYTTCGNEIESFITSLLKKQSKQEQINAIVRVPASLFKGIDKRKRRIPIIMITDGAECVITVDRARL